MKKTQNTGDKTYCGYVVPGKWNENDTVETISLFGENFEYLLESQNRNINPVSYMDSYVEVSGTVTRRGEAEILSITSIKEVPSPDFDEDEDFDDIDLDDDK